jgi:preprotein translocase subunit SecF
LVYVAFRFELQWGTAAVLALIHDTVVTLGLFALFGYEMSLPVVAAFLTLIGYSVNDTVVIFDRIREVIAARGTGDLYAVINQSVNQTLSRSIITSGLTWFVCLSLFFFGGEALRPFSFVLVVGIVAGSYSTIYVASALVLMTRSWFHRKEAAAREPAPAPAERKARKVRTTPPNR